MTGRICGRSAVCGVLVAAILVGNTAIARAQGTSTVPCYSYDENCKSIIKKTAIVGGILIGVLILWKIVSGTHKKAQSDAPPNNLNIFFEPTNGTAELHMVMRSVSNNCPGSWGADSARVVSGKLPPGLKLEEDRRITGTPLGSGTWVADIVFTGLRCEGRNGKTKTYADRRVPVTIHIE